MIKLVENSKIALISVLVAIIAVSGCLGGGGDGVRVAGSGEDALELSIDTEGRTTFDSLEPFIITIQAENVGEYDAENVTARLQGYDGIIGMSDTTLSAYKKFMPPTLDRPNYENEVPGGTGDVDWSVKAPFISEDAPDVNINLVSEIMYDYKSLAARKVVIAAASEIEKLDQRGEDISVESATEAMNGPISIEVESEEPYVRMALPKEDFRLKITLSNDGNGNVYDRYSTNDDKKLDYIKKVILRVPAGLDVSDCEFDLESPSGGSIIDAEKTLVIKPGSDYEDKLRLTQGGATRDLHCTLTAFEDHVAGFNTYNIQVIVEYSYLQSVTKKISMLGTEEAPIKLSIKYPTKTQTDDWNTSEVHSINFTLTYQGKAVKADIDKSDVRVEVGGVPATVSVVDYDSGSGVYEALVLAPFLAIGQYDLDVEVDYGELTAIDVESSAIDYKVSE